MPGEPWLAEENDLLRHLVSIDRGGEDVEWPPATWVEIANDMTEITPFMKINIFGRKYTATSVSDHWRRMEDAGPVNTARAEEGAERMKDELVERASRTPATIEEAIAAGRAVAAERNETARKIKDAEEAAAAEKAAEQPGNAI